MLEEINESLLARAHQFFLSLGVLGTLKKTLSGFFVDVILQFGTKQDLYVFLALSVCFCFFAVEAI